tara:strand:+ start:3715 stop:3894 length:180 start_codon:yes stop_codon:yes gene_type:complete
MIDINQIRALIAALHTIKDDIEYDHAFYYDVTSAIYALNNIDKTYKAVTEMQIREVEAA